MHSPTLAQLLRLMLPPSDNFFAETLVKDLGARFGGAGTTAAGAAVVRADDRRAFGIHPHVVDGSGLSRPDQTCPDQVADLLAELAADAARRVLRDDLAVAGQHRHARRRMRGHRAPRGAARARPGTLTGVSNLAGYCQDAADGAHCSPFAVFTDGPIATGPLRPRHDPIATDHQLDGSTLSPALRAERRLGTAG